MTSGKLEAGVGVGREGLVCEQRHTGDRGLRGDLAKDLRERKGKLKVVKGWRSRGDGKGYISDEIVWGRY